MTSDTGILSHAPRLPDAASVPIPGYRREVDGLRAVAILPVVLFHAGFPGLSGGFLGVDVFFVISGYLITTLILRDIAQGRFSILTFYERRARRILPALIFTVLCAIPLAAWFLFPWQFANFGWSVTATAGFYANYYFLGTIDYFKEGADRLPLLHMWSLAIEEQYYILLPPALVLLWRIGLRRRALLGLILGASLLSLAAAVLLVTRKPADTFYLLPTRAFELGIGSLLATLLMGRPLPRTRANGALAALGLGLILGTMLLLPEDALLPSWPSVLPCLGAALILAFATEGTAVHRLLASPPAVFIGLISFSVYLWHQPLFAFARAATAVPSPELMAGLALLSIALGAFNWRFIEGPTRHAAVPRATVLWAAALSLITLGGLGLLIARTAPTLQTIRPEDRQLAVSADDRGAFVSTRYNALPTDFATAPAGAKRLLLIGDSHSQDFYNMVLATGAFSGWAVATHYIPTLCQTYFGPEDIDRFLAPGDRRRCRARHEAEGVREIARQADVVVMIDSWRLWSAERAAGTIAALDLRPEQKLIVIGKKNFGHPFLRGFLGQSAGERAATRVPVSPETAAINAALVASLPNETVIDFETLICPEASCPLFTPEGDLISHDGDHLTEKGAAWAGAKLFADPRLRPFLAANP